MERGNNLGKKTFSEKAILAFVLVNLFMTPMVFSSESEQSYSSVAGTTQIISNSFAKVTPLSSFETNKADEKINLMQIDKNGHPYTDINWSGAEASYDIYHMVNTVIEKNPLNVSDGRIIVCDSQDATPQCPGTMPNPLNGGISAEKLIYAGEGVDIHTEGASMPSGPARLRVNADCSTPGNCDTALVLNTGLSGDSNMTAFSRQGNVKVMQTLTQNDDYALWLNGANRLSIKQNGDANFSGNATVSGKVVIGDGHTPFDYNLVVNGNEWILNNTEIWGSISVENGYGGSNYFSGPVGIGVDPPRSRLDVNGNILGTYGYTFSASNVESKLYLLGSLPNSTSDSNFHKMMVTIWGGKYGSDNLGQTIYMVGSRTSLTATRTRLFGLTPDYPLLMYKNESDGKYFAVLNVTGSFWKIVGIRSQIFDIKGFTEQVVRETNATELSTLTPQTYIFTDLISVDGAGNLGVGVYNPTAKLDVRGTAKIEDSGETALVLKRASNTTAYGTSINFTLLNNGSVDKTYARMFGLIENATSGSEKGDILFQTMNGNLSNAMLINSEGNVAIGTNVGTLSPLSKLHIRGGGLRLSRYSINSGFVFEQDSSSYDLQITYNNETGVVRNIMTLKDDNGNVGIGVTSPSAKLHIGSDGYPFTFNTTINGGSCSLGRCSCDTSNSTSDCGSSTTYNVAVAQCADYISVGATCNYRQYIRQAKTDDFVVTDTGQVGIGTTTPGSTMGGGGGYSNYIKLDVVNQDQGYIRISSDASTQSAGIWLHTSNSTKGGWLMGIKDGNLKFAYGTGASNEGQGLGKAKDVVSGVTISQSGDITGASLSLGSGSISAGAISGTSLSLGSGSISAGAISGTSLSVTGDISAPTITVGALGKLVLPYHQGSGLDSNGGSACNQDQEGAIMYNQPDHNFYGCKYSTDSWCNGGNAPHYCWDNLN